MRICERRGYLLQKAYNEVQNALISHINPKKRDNLYGLHSGIISRLLGF